MMRELQGHPFYDRGQFCTKLGHLLATGEGANGLCEKLTQDDCKQLSAFFERMAARQGDDPEFEAFYVGLASLLLRAEIEAARQVNVLEAMQSA